MLESVIGSHEIGDSASSNGCFCLKPKDWNCERSNWWIHF